MQRMGGIGGNAGGNYNEVFQGDMNAVVRNNPQQNVARGGNG